MVKQATIYTLPSCPRCELAKHRLESLGYGIEQRSLAALAVGQHRDIEAMAELQLNDGAAPIVVIDGEVVRDWDKLQEKENLNECRS